MGIFDKFKSGFKKSASAFTSGLRDIVIKKEIDDKTWDKIEEYLMQSDVGIIAAAEIKEIITDSKIDPKKDIAEEINTILKEYIVSLMKPLENDNFFKKKDLIRKKDCLKICRKIRKSMFYAYCILTCLIYRVAEGKVVFLIGLWEKEIYKLDYIGR